MDATVSTNMVARLMPIAVSIFFETPMNGQSPRNFTRTKLLINAVLIIRRRYSVIMIFARAVFGAHKLSGILSPFLVLRTIKNLGYLRVLGGDSLG